MKPHRLAFALAALTAVASLAQESEDPFGAPSGSPTTPSGSADPFGQQHPVKFVIMLQGKPKAGDLPFMDAYDLQSQLSSRGIAVNINSIRIDTSASIPSKNMIIARVSVPESQKNHLQTIQDACEQEAIKYGITEVETNASPDVEKMACTVVTHSGMLSASFDFLKIVAAAQALDKESPTIAIYKAQDNSSTFVDEFPMAMSGMGGMGSGMNGMGGGMGSLPVAPAVNPWAPETGYVQAKGLLVSWSTKTRTVAALGSGQSGWIRVKIPSDKMTRPIVDSGFCVFMSGDQAFGFSSLASRWATVDLHREGKELPQLIFDGYLATIQLDDDLLVFTKDGRWLSRNASMNQEQANSETPEDGSGGMSGMSPGYEYGMGIGSGDFPIEGQGMMAMGQAAPPSLYDALNISQPATSEEARIKITDLRTKKSQLESSAKEMLKEPHFAINVQVNDESRNKLREIADQVVMLETEILARELLLVSERLKALHRELRHRQDTPGQGEALCDEWLSQPR